MKKKLGAIKHAVVILSVAALCGCGDSGPAATRSPGGPGSGSPPGLAIPTLCGGAVPVSSPRLIPNVGRTVTPFGRMTTVGNLPTGGALSRDGRYYWSVSAGDGHNDVQIVDVASGNIVQILPLPGSFGQMAFSPDGLTAYVSGEPIGVSYPPTGPTMADSGGAVHVFKIDPVSGTATEQMPITLTLGANAFPTGLAVSPDGKTLAVALYHVAQAAVIDLASGTETDVAIGQYPFGVRFDRTGASVYVTNAQDGTVSKIDLATKVTTTISGIGGPSGDYNAQPQYILADPNADRLYVAVTNHDGIAVINTQTNSLVQFVSLKRTEGFGSAPTALALAPDGSTLYASLAGENSVAAIALADRPGGAKAYSLLGKIPTADYPQDVAVSPNGCNLVWASARGLGVGGNPSYGVPWEASYTVPYGGYVPDRLIGIVGVLPTPNDVGFAISRPLVEHSIVPGDGSGVTATVPVSTPIPHVDGQPSQQIKYVFYVVKENRTYDQIFGSVPRGEGDASMQVAEDNCGPQNTAFEGTDRKHPGCGTTPNAHALSRQFVLLDHFFEDSEVSSDGHLITSSSYATNSATKIVPSSYSGRETLPDADLPISLPPMYTVFDQAVRQGVTFRNYGEPLGAIPSAGTDRADTFATVVANLDAVYLANWALSLSASVTCGQSSQLPGFPNVPNCTFDSGLGVPPPLANSLIDRFNTVFQAQLVAGNVPQFNYIALPDDHTSGTTAGMVQPLSEVADNDLAVGQLVQLISHSSIWSQSAIFVVEDDSQDGADHLEAHRAPALVVSPWVRRGGAVVRTHYDLYSVLRTMELILGMHPLSIYDANATPMYEVFAATHDDAAYTAIIPERPLTAINAANAPNAALSKALPFDRLDAVPQELADRILWQSVFGADSTPPRPGPHGSIKEHQRAVEALRSYAKGGDPRRVLGDQDDDD